MISPDGSVSVHGLDLDNTLLPLGSGAVDTIARTVGYDFDTWYTAAQTAADTVSAARDSEDAARPGRVAANLLYINNKKLELADIREAAEKAADATYEKESRDADNTYLTTALGTATTFLHTYATAIDQHTTDTRDAYTTFYGRATAAYNTYDTEACRLTGLYLDAVALADGGTAIPSDHYAPGRLPITTPPSSSSSSSSSGILLPSGMPTITLCEGPSTNSTDSDRLVECADMSTVLLCGGPTSWGDLQGGLGFKPERLESQLPKHEVPQYRKITDEQRRHYLDILERHAMPDGPEVIKEAHYPSAPDSVPSYVIVRRAVISPIGWMPSFYATDSFSATPTLNGPPTIDNTMEKQIAPLLDYTVTAAGDVRLIDTLADFLLGGPPRQWYFPPSHPLSKRLRSHEGLTHVFRFFDNDVHRGDLQEAIMSYGVERTQRLWTEFTPPASWCYDDLSTGFGTYDPGHLYSADGRENNDMYINGLGGFKYFVEVKIDYLNHTKDLTIHVFNTWSTPSGTRNPFTRKPLIKHDLLNRVGVWSHYHEVQAF